MSSRWICRETVYNSSHEGVAFPPRLRLSRRPSCSVQWGHTGCRLRRASCAADEPDASSSAEVKHSYTTSSSVRRSALSSRCLFNVSKCGGEKRSRKKRHIAVKYLQKIGCVDYGGAASLPLLSCPLRGSKKALFAFTLSQEETFLILPKPFNRTETSLNYKLKYTYETWILKEQYTDFLKH